MKKSYVMTLALCIVMIGVLGCSKTEPVAETETVAVAETAVEATMEEAPAARHDVVFACNCGPECDCGSISAEPGTCTCGTELVGTHVVKVDGNDAMLCTCGNECDCEISAEDETKCSCGSDLKTVSLEGSGLYYCNCGGSCTCNFVSAEAGDCKCGMELITS